MGILALSAPAIRQAPPTVARVGNYQVELRLPGEGLFANEAIDVEFRVSNLALKDPIEGYQGVPNASPTATVTMPAMPGMPVAKPKIHSEGVPGDYGLELFFPHGGDFKIGLRVSPTGAKPIFAAFTVRVKDADQKPRGKTASLPFRAELLGLPKEPRSGQPIRLNVAIKDNQTGEIVRRFDVAHTKLIHLILVSKDLGWFEHAHPVQQADGTFVLNQAFPAGGDYLVFADVAPKDKGSQVLGTHLLVRGSAPSWPTKLKLSRISRENGIVATLASAPLPVGESTSLTFELHSASTGRPVADLQPYLGAHGHLMIVHQDGKSFVHSHPAEGAESDALLKKGEVRFNARFPRPGIYKAWTQFQRNGKVVTFPFVIKVGLP